MEENLKVGDLMTGKVFALGPEDNLATLRDLMEDRHVRHVPVVDGDGNIVGIVTHRDLLRSCLVEQTDVPFYIEADVLERVRVSDIMTSAVECVEATADIRVAAEIMFENKYGCLPVVEGSRVVGILTESDFVRFMAHGH